MRFMCDGDAMISMTGSFCRDSVGGTLELFLPKVTLALVPMVTGKGGVGVGSKN